MKTKTVFTAVAAGMVIQAIAGNPGAELQRRIDEAAAAGGGRVVVKAGVHHTGTIRLKSHVELHLEEGAVLLASTNRADYAEFPREVCPVAPENMRAVVVAAWDAEDIAITGKGTIDGQGPAFYDRKPPRGHWPKPKFRPLMVQFVRCKGIRFEGVTFKDSPMWTMFIRLCEDIAMDGIRIVANQQMINNDGIDFDGCRRVRVGNSFFKTGDDCLILRAMRARPDEHIVCEDIVVSNCVLNSTCQTIRMGAPSDDTIRNALFKDIKASGRNGIFFDYPVRYLRPYDEGYMDISGIVFDGYEGSVYGSAVQIVAEPGIKIRGVRDVTFKNFNVKSAFPLRFVGNADSVLKDVKLENFKAEVKDGDPFVAVATEPLAFRNCTFNGKKVPDRDLVTPRGERKPLKRLYRSSWENLDQSVPASPKATAVSSVPALKYAPVPGGFAAKNGNAEFNRPLYGWHGDDRELSPCKSLPWASDRPKVALKVFRGYRIDKKVRGVLQFGDGTEDVEYRYVWGRAEYDLKGKGTVKMVRSASSDGLLVETTGGLPPKFDGEWTLAAKGARDGRTYYDFERKGGPFNGKDAGTPNVAEMFDAATNHFERIARTIEIRTPDPILDSLLPCQLLVADAMFEGRHITHGATNWKQAFAGWRVAYICYATGWEDRFKENAREHFRSQRADGRIPNEPKRDSQYNMCEEFAVSVMRYWKWTHDDDFMREIAYDGVKRHLAWMDRNMKVPGMELYENWLNTWNTDDKWCNGGAGTIASAYYAFDCRVMAEVAQRLGKADDAAYFAARAKAVENAIAKNLWHEGDGVWGEYRERFGLKRLMRAPDLSTVYVAIDNLPFDLVRNRRAVAWVEDNVPTHFAKDGATLLYSSNRLPLFWTSCGRYPNETIFWALACYQAGEPELGWRNLHDAAVVSARGAGCGPGVGTCDLNFDFACYSNIDFADNTAGFLRTVAEGVFGIVDGREIRPSFPASWNEAEIKSPYLSYRWTRKGGVKVTGGSRAATVKVVPAPAPQFAGAAIPPRHSHWGHPKGEGSDLSIPQGAKAEFVDLSKSFNQNLRLLHAGKYSPRIANKPWSRIPRTIMANGRSWWEHHETAGNRRWPKDYAVPKSLDRWPADGALATEYGPSFRLGPKEGNNAAFVSFYEQFPDAIDVPLSGRARKLSLLTAVVTNPNVAWMEAACVKVQYADGSEETLSLVPPDNCDDWLNYSQGQWSYYDAKRDNRPYAVKGRPVMLGETAHANAHAIALDPAKELKSLRIECRGTETFAGLLSATLYRK